MSQNQNKRNKIVTKITTLALAHDNVFYWNEMFLLFKK